MFDNSLMGSLARSTGSVATGAGVAEQTLQSYTLPANALRRNGQAIRIRAFGHFATNGNNKTVKIYFGAQSLSSGTLTDSNKNWYAEMFVIRTGAATQTTLATMTHDTTQITPSSIAGTDDLTAAVTIKVTGTDGSDSAGDITCDGFSVEGLLEP